ncbi:MAG: hypothetical protein U0Q12_08925 [Vicinamibacterales bacterium]
MDRRRVTGLVLWMLAFAGLGALVKIDRDFSPAEPLAGSTTTITTVSPPSTPDPPSARAVARRLGRARSGWRVVDEISAQRIAVVKVEADHLDEAPTIAAQLVEPYKARYSEVLLYFSRPGHSGPLPDLRIQWTPAGGYVQITYDTR